MTPDLQKAKDCFERGLILIKEGKFSEAEIELLEANKFAPAEAP